MAGRSSLMLEVFLRRYIFFSAETTKLTTTRSKEEEPASILSSPTYTYIHILSDSEPRLCSARSARPVRAIARNSERTLAIAIASKSFVHGNSSGGGERTRSFATAEGICARRLQLPDTEATGGRGCIRQQQNTALFFLLRALIPFKRRKRRDE
jgi:hypothetical protein